MALEYHSIEEETCQDFYSVGRNASYTWKVQLEDLLFLSESCVSPFSRWYVHPYNALTVTVKVERRKKAKTVRFLISQHSLLQFQPHLMNCAFDCSQEEGDREIVLQVWKGGSCRPRHFWHEIHCLTQILAVIHSRRFLLLMMGNKHSKLSRKFQECEVGNLKREAETRLQLLVEATDALEVFHQHHHDPRPSVSSRWCAGSRETCWRWTTQCRSCRGAAQVQRGRAQGEVNNIHIL